MKVKYIGPFDEVEVPYTEDGRAKTAVFKRNHQTEVPDDLANGVEGEFGGLLEQTDNYVAVESPKAKADKD